MTRLGSLPRLGRRTVLLAGATAGTALGVAAAGVTAARALGRRPGRDPAAGEQLGQLHGRVVPVVAGDGVPLHVEIDEVADGLPVTVVFCHGLGLDQGAWHYQRRDLEDAGRLVFWDQRGHGLSGRGADERLTIDQLGDDLKLVLDAVAPSGPVILVGHSMGGMTVMALADRHPQLFGERVVGVALLATSAGKLAGVGFGVPAAAGRALRAVAPRALTTLSRRPDLVARGLAIGADVQLVLTRRYSFSTDVTPSITRFVAAMHARTPLDVIAALMPAFTDHDKLAALRVLNDVQTLVLVGRDDRMTPANHSRDIARQLRRAELVIVPHAGHMVMVEHPDLVNGRLGELVKRVLRSTAVA